MNFTNVLRAVKKHWVTEIVLFCVVVGAVVGCTLTMTPQYKATAELLIQASSSSSNATDATSQSQAFSASSVSSVSSLCPDILQSDSVLQSVIDNLGLHSNVSQLRQSVSAVVDEKSPVIQIMALYPDSDQVVKIVEESTRQLNKQLSSTLGSSVKVTLPTIQQPVKPLVPSSPNVPACIAIGIIAGLIVALLGAVIREMSDKGVNETSDIQAIIDSPILASIPKAHTVSDGTPAVIVKPRGHAAEEFHRLTTNVSFVTPNELNQSNVLIVTSSNPREGKTTVAVNLAASFAEKGKSVLLIDGDVRHPSVANALDLNNGIGLVSLLAGDVSAKDAIQTYWKPYLHILPSEDQNTTSGIVLGSDA
ncbi:chain length determinant protein [Bifidobacterium merycicum]|uniref:Chain length determinant protein n=3 Tax=Bifidobacterium merycicum TaxID=78345 RepID=A0A087BF48_9BIFI|nr:AAA family ATPase [Bifidobacterium merycicum]KFI69648.1 chain length determinant protein [Bifidobacterium merycicum]